MEEAEKIKRYFAGIKSQMDKLLKDSRPMREMAEKVLKQPQELKRKYTKIGKHRVTIILLENKNIIIEPENREQADSLFNELHLYKKSLFNVGIRIFGKDL